MPAHCKLYNSRNPVRCKNKYNLMESDHTQSEAKLLFKIFNFVSNVKIIQYTFNFPDLSFQMIFRARRGSRESNLLTSAIATNNIQIIPIPIPIHTKHHQLCFHTILATLKHPHSQMQY